MSSKDVRYEVSKSRIDIHALTNTNRSIASSFEPHVGSRQTDDRGMQNVFRAAKHGSTTAPLPQLNHTHDKTNVDVKVCSVNASKSDNDVPDGAGDNAYTNIQQTDEVHGKEELRIGQRKRDIVTTKAKKICRTLRTSAAVSIGLALLGERIFELVTTFD
jgi:hypothetical protein